MYIFTIIIGICVTLNYGALRGNLAIDNINLIEIVSMTQNWISYLHRIICLYCILRCMENRIKCVIQYSR